MAFNFHLQKSALFLTLRWKAHPNFKFAPFLKKLFFILFILSFSLFFFKEFDFLLGLSLFSLVLAIYFWLQEDFFNSILKNPPIKIPLSEVVFQPEKYNLADFLSFEVAKAVFESIKWVKKNNQAVNSSLLFYFLLLENPKLNFIFSRALLSLKKIKEILKESLKIDLIKEKTEFSEDFQKTILEALKIALKKNHQRIELTDIIPALSKNNLIFKEILISANLKEEDIENLAFWLEKIEKKIEKEKRFWEWGNLVKKGFLAKEWASGYTILLDQFSFDVTRSMRRQKFREIFAHKIQVEQVERILASPEKNNVLIVGEPGSGRRSIIEALAKNLALGESLPQLNFKRVIFCDLTKILAMTKSTEETEEILEKIFQEVILAGNVILVIDNLQEYVGLAAERKAGVVDISGLISPYLSSPHFQCIGITTFEGLHKILEQNKAFLDLFEKVEVPEVSLEEALLILEDRVLRLEEKYKVFFSWPALREIVSLSGKYLPAIPFPEKAIEIADELATARAFQKEKIILTKDVESIISQKSEVPVGEIEEKEKEKLLNLEKLIHQRIVNQEEAVREIASALRRARTQITIRKGPIGSFLFLGPTGVGKTETARALAQIYFGLPSPILLGKTWEGEEERMIRLDMSEFQNLSDIPRLIGAPGQEGLLTTKVKENPFSLLLLDEFEKANLDILNLFLQVLDEGYLTDGLGRKVDFKNTIIIATSNAGYQVILESLRENLEWKKVKEKLLDFIFEKGIFRPELINRFDGVILFRPLSKENLLAIADLLLQKIKKKLKEKEIEFLITDKLKEKIVELGYDITFGARAMERTISEKVGNLLAEAILKGELKRGNKVEIDPTLLSPSGQFTLKINP